MSRSVSIAKLMRAIRKLPSDDPVDTPGKWYRTQKEHWLVWLSEYHGPGAYGRTGKAKRDAAYAYNHIVEPKMLLWIIEAAGVQKSLLEPARKAAKSEITMMAQSAAIRKQVSWETMAAALLGND